MPHARQPPPFPVPFPVPKPRSDNRRLADFANSSRMDIARPVPQQIIPALPTTIRRSAQTRCHRSKANAKKNGRQPHKTAPRLRSSLSLTTRLCKAPRRQTKSRHKKFPQKREKLKTQAKSCPWNASHTPPTPLSAKSSWKRKSLSHGRMNVEISRGGFESTSKRHSRLSVSTPAVPVLAVPTFDVRVRSAACLGMP